MLQSISKHLNDSQVDYRGHMLFALKAGCWLLYAGVASIIHGLVPFLFPATAAKIVIRLYHERLKNHPNPEYQQALLPNTPNK
ncbi:MAG TPA: DUF6356 family protein [Candidatus Paceibacterota bacterium]|nr:DUF6356 family protein [Candidatus Paceibacterota bacterium]